MLDALRQDLRFALRLTRRTPFMSLTAAAALAIAFGLATAGFTLVRALFFGTLPGPYGNRIVAIHEFNRTGGWRVPLALAELERRRQDATAFDDIGAFHVRSVSAGEAGTFGVVRVAFVTPNTFDILGVRPRSGRLLRPPDAEPGTAQALVLGETLARRIFGSDADAVGRLVRVDGRLREVVGIVGADCRFPDRVDAWLPLGPAATLAAPLPAVSMFGRLRAGVSAREAAAEMDVIAAGNPDRLKDAELVSIVEPFARSNADPHERRTAIAAAAGVALLVLVFAANVANLMLARTAARRRELAVRAALGASRRRLIGQIALEALGLALAAAVAGAVAASRGLGWAAHRFGHPPYWIDLGLDPVVLLFVLALAIAATLVAGLAPAVKVVSSAVQDGLREGTGRLRFGRLSGAVVVVELAVAVALLGGAALIGRGLLAFGYERYRFSAEQVVVAQLYFGQPPALSRSASALTRDERVAIWRAFERRADDAQRAIVDALERTPGVRVSRAMHFPGNDTPNARVEVETGRGPLSTASRVVEIDDRFLEILGAAPVSGRGFRVEEVRNGANVALVNVPFARKYFGAESPIGRRVRPAGRGAWREIVGVVPDLALNPGAPSSADGVYVPLGPTNVLVLGIRTPQPERMEHDLHQAALAAELRPQVQWAMTLLEQMNTTEAIFRGFGSVMFAAGGAALLLACAGVYAMVAFDLTQRRKEIAIRIAIGARRRDVARAILGRTVAQMSIGAVAGAGLAAIVHRLIGTLPITVEAGDPLFAVAVTLLLSATALAACARPLATALGTRPTDWLKDG